MQNPKPKKLDERFFVLMADIKDSQYGKPIDQLNQLEKAIIFNHGNWFTNDNGYIKLTANGKQRLHYEFQRRYGRGANPVMKNPKPFYATKNNTDVETWFERDRAYVELKKSANDETLIELWDDDVNEAFEDGFLNRRDLHGSLVDWYNSMHNSKRNALPNPHGFAIIDEHLNVVARGKDYDKLQDKVDRHNEDSSNIWMVVDAGDLAELNLTERSYEKPNPNKRAKHTYKPELQYNHYVLRNDKGDYIRREIDGTIARFKTEAQALEYLEREEFVDLVDSLFRNPANDNELYRAYRSAVYDMARRKGVAINNVDIDLRKGYAIARDNSGYLYQIKLTPKGVSKNWVAATAWRDNDYSRNPISSELRDAIAKESDKLASESERLKQVVGNPYRDEVDEAAAWELYLYVTNDSAFVNQINSIRKNLITKMAQGKYDSARAPQAFSYVVDAANKKYNKEFGDTFDKATRMESARQMAQDFEAEAAIGNYDYMLPAKYKKNPRKIANEHYGKVDFFDDKVDEISAEFTGGISGESIEAEAADGTPRKLARLGHLRLIKITDSNGKEYEVKFNDNDEAWLAADRRKNLYFVGKDTNMTGAVKLPKPNHVLLLGNVTQIDYFTAKQHIESAKPTYFYHELGEVDGITPTAYVDSDGFIRLYGGNYDIWTCGIVN